MREYSCVVAQEVNFLNFFKLAPPESEGSNRMQLTAPTADVLWWFTSVVWMPHLVPVTANLLPGASLMIISAPRPTPRSGNAGVHRCCIFVDGSPAAAATDVGRA